jgi:hypothetical protein
MLLRIYPHTFREEFAEEILLDFSDMARDASKKGIFSLFVFCLHELFEFPINLLRIHLKEGLTIRIFRSQPVNYGLRSALGFGVAFALAIPVSMFINTRLLRLIFPMEEGFGIISWIPTALSHLLTGLVLGVLFALSFADRSKYHRYILAGLLGWLLRNVMSDLLNMSFNFRVFLDGNQLIYFDDMVRVFSGAVFGLILVVAKSERPEAIHWLGLGIFAYPLFTDLYVGQLFHLFVFDTPWRFVGLTILMLILVVSVFVLALKSDDRQELPLIVILGAVGYPLVLYIGRFFHGRILPSLDLAYQADYSVSAFWRSVFIVSIEQAIYGILFGLLLGLVLGIQKKSDSPPLIT